MCMNELQQFKKILKAHNVSITQARLAVFITLQQAHEPLKTGEVARRTSNVNRTSVYRTLELFTKLGITATIVRGWIPHTELAEPFKAHHHHFICSRCQDTVSIEDEQLENTLATIARHHGFTVEHHTVELSGLCQHCQSTPR